MLGTQSVAYASDEAQGLALTSERARNCKCTPLINKRTVPVADEAVALDSSVLGAIGEGVADRIPSNSAQAGVQHILRGRGRTKGNRLANTHAGRPQHTTSTAPNRSWGNAQGQPSTGGASGARTLRRMFRAFLLRMQPAATCSIHTRRSEQSDELMSHREPATERAVWHHHRRAPRRRSTARSQRCCTHHGETSLHHEDQVGREQQEHHLQHGRGGRGQKRLVGSCRSTPAGNFSVPRRVQAARIDSHRGRMRLR